MLRTLILGFILFSALTILNAAYSVNVVSVDAPTSTAVVEVTADGRTGPYTVVINLDLANIEAGNTTATFNNIGYGDHVAIIENSYGCTVELPFSISDCPLEVKFYLEGAFNGDLEGNFIGESNVMSSGLFDRGLLPGQTPVSPLAIPTPSGQPYNQDPWNYNGTEGAAWTDIDYVLRFRDAEPVDWALLTLISSTDLLNHTELYKVAGVVDEDGGFHYTCPSNLREIIGLDTEFYTRIEHRNHMGILSPEPFNFSDDGPFAAFDFTTADSYHDPTSFGQIQLNSSMRLWGMFGGDSNQSDLPSYDITGMDKTEWFETNGIFDNYLPGDMNLDGDVNGMDKAIWFENNGKSSRVPKN